MTTIKTAKHLGRRVGYITPLAPEGEGGVITAVETPWISSGDDTLLFTVRLWDGRIVSAMDTDLVW
jgi:hypothetical protein